MVVRKGAAGCQVPPLPDFYCNNIHRTLAKVNVLGTNFASVLRQEIDLANLPKCVGGEYDKEAPEFEFDTSENGLLWYNPESVQETTEIDETKEEPK